MAVGSYVDIDDWEARMWAQLPAGVEHGVITDCAVDAQDNVYLACRSGPLVLIYDARGQFLRSWGQNVPGNRPHGITVAPDGSVLIASDQEHTVRTYTPTGEELRVIGASGVPSDTGVGEWSLGLAKRLLSIKHSAGPFNGPTRVAVGPGGDLYVSDGYGNARVHQFSPSGELIRSWGEPGPGPGQFYLPHGLGVARDGRVFVADQQNDRVQVYSSDGVWLEVWSDLYHPLQVVVAGGFVYVSEGSTPSIAHPDRPLPARISVFDLDGQVVERFGQKPPGDPNRLRTPHGLAVDSRGNVHVAHLPEGHRVGEPQGRTLYKFARVA